MISFSCTHCGHKYQFNFLPIPDEGAVFKCANCNRNARLLLKGSIVFCVAEEDSESDGKSSTMELGNSYQAAVEDSMSPEELESRLSGLFPELPYDIEFLLGVTAGPDQGTTFLIKKPRVVIGKTGCDINLKDSRVSREHCQIEIFGNRMTVLRDLRSTGGTFRNEYPIQLGVLNPGDTIQLGETKLLFISNTKKSAS